MTLDPVVQKPVNANLGLKVHPRFLLLKSVPTAKFELQFPLLILSHSLEAAKVKILD